MENLINKWKKMMNNEKTQSSARNENNIAEDNNNIAVNRSNNLTSSHMSARSDRSNKFIQIKSPRNNAESLLLRSNSSQPKSPSCSSLGKSKSMMHLCDADKIIQLLSKTVAYIQKSQENCNPQKIVDNINEAIELHVHNLNNHNMTVKRFDEKEIIWQTKCDTAEKMIKDFELKVLSSEKEKTKLKKQIEEIKDNLNDFKEKNEFLSKSNDFVSLLEKNNKVLIKTNEQLTEQLNELKFKHDCMIKKFEEEITYIKEKLEFYKSNLTKIFSSVYEGKQLNL